jgi:hypothetical protein
MSIHPKVNGSYKEMATCKVKVGGAWKQAAKVLAKVDGAWREVWSNLAVNTVIYYGISNIPVKGTGIYMRLRGLTITVKNASNDSIIKVITDDDTGLLSSVTYALPDGGQLLMSVNGTNLKVELWSSGTKAEIKIREAELTNSK